MEAIIFGSGPTRKLIKKVPDNIFTVSCNLSFPNSHLIFAQDEPIIDKIVEEYTEGFSTQTVFAPLRAYERYVDSGRLLLINEDKLFPRTQGLSTGILAIGTLLKLGFTKLYLCGFSFDKVGGTIEKLTTVFTNHQGEIDKTYFTKLYCIVEKPLLLEPPTPNFITKEAFYNGHGKIKRATGD
tara:strand:- start:1042 stop:1590 length:549 start_codon:yes stop_codon:yes gene_type:complete